MFIKLLRCISKSKSKYSKPNEIVFNCRNGKWQNEIDSLMVCYTSDRRYNTKHVTIQIQFHSNYFCNFSYYWLVSFRLPPPPLSLPLPLPHSMLFCHCTMPSYIRERSPITLYSQGYRKTVIIGDGNMKTVSVRVYINVCVCVFAT